MEVFTRLDDIRGRYDNSAVALGTFDGVHIGHQRIISQAAACARESGGACIVFTFSNHPLSVIDPDRSPPLLVSAAYRTELIAALGADALLSVLFDRELLALPPAAFIDLLVDYLHPTCVVVGPNYSFGHRGAGTPAMLAEAGRQRGFRVVVPSAVEAGGKMVSSTLIRQLILNGEVAAAAPLLGRPFRVSGVVEKGEGRGRTLGFPTANITAAAGQIVPADGVYAVRVHTGGQSYRGVANIGANPTFRGKTRHIEAHLLDFSGDLYGQTLAVDFLAKLRDERAFSGADELMAQIARDIAAAKNHYK